MKRDMDLIRDILKLMEANEDPMGIGEITIEGQDLWLINYHIGLLVEANFIAAIEISPRSGSSPTVWFPEHIKWEGHEFLAATSDDSVWDKVKGTVKEKGGAFTVPILTQLAVGYLKHNLHLP
jgi:hypothetical protein